MEMTATQVFVSDLHQRLEWFWSTTSETVQARIADLQRRVERELEARDNKIRRLETAARASNTNSSSIVDGTGVSINAAIHRNPQSLNRAATQQTMSPTEQSSGDNNSNISGALSGSQLPSNRDSHLAHRESEVQRKETQLRRREGELRRKESQLIREQRKKKTEIKVLRRLTKSYRLVARVEMQAKLGQIPYFLRRATPGIVQRSSTDVPDDSSSSSSDG